MLANQVRIVGGRWRGRKIVFPDLPGLRPTPDRVKETLFNWLAPVIHEAHCLDAFAGSGALGFEALSRGAVSVVMVEQSADAVLMLRENAKKLNATGLEVVHGNFPYILTSYKKKFDIVFLDPPFHQNLIEENAKWLEENHCLTEAALIYIETETQLSDLELPFNWKIIRNKKAGNVNFYLVQRNAQ